MTFHRPFPFDGSHLGDPRSCRPSHAEYATDQSLDRWIDGFHMISSAQMTHLLSHGTQDTKDHTNWSGMCIRVVNTRRCAVDRCWDLSKGLTDCRWFDRQMYAFRGLID